MSSTKNILVCPLEWGLGHAGRMVPLVVRLMEMNHNVFIGTGTMHQSFFKREVPDLTYIDFSGYKPSYSRILPQYLKLLLEFPVLVFHIIREHIIVKKIISKHAIDIVISDNRFGLWNRKITSVYITHMPRVPFPAAISFLEFTGILLHRLIIKKYSLCFIPDLQGEVNITGRLSHGLKLPDNVRFIGILSRFKDRESQLMEIPVKEKHNTVILSGPEPQKSILKKRLSDVMEKEDRLTVFLGGEPDASRLPVQKGKTIMFNHLDTPEMREVILNSDFIITRSGYTMIMELISLNRTALLIPTPGQTEQEYLAERLSEIGWFNTIAQKKISEKLPLTDNYNKWPGQILNDSKILLENALDEMLKQVK